MWDDIKPRLDPNQSGSTDDLLAMTHEWYKTTQGSIKFVRALRLDLFQSGWLDHNYNQALPWIYMLTIFNLWRRLASVSTCISWNTLLRFSMQDMLRIYLSVVRPFVEYACQVWGTCLPQYLSGKMIWFRNDHSEYRSSFPVLDHRDTCAKANIHSQHYRRCDYVLNGFFQSEA